MVLVSIAKQLVWQTLQVKFSCWIPFLNRVHIFITIVAIDQAWLPQPMDNDKVVKVKVLYEKDWNK